MRLALNVIKNQRPVLGGFEKATEGGLALNFSLSGAKNCDKACIYHPDNKSMPEKNRCYAARIEKRPDRQFLRAKLDRHYESGADEVCRRALAELQHHYGKKNARPVPWLRISAFGSVPQPEDATPEFIEALNALLDFCDEKNIPVHFPAETRAKADFYRKAIGTRAVVRQSAQALRLWTQKGSRSAMSIVAGTSDMTRDERLAEARRLAKLRTEATNRKAIVCPAVASRYINLRRAIDAGDKKWFKVLGDPKAKCGNCTACSQAGVDIVYPSH